ncbi:MAG: LysM peptidoglycan-binding domain-containing protein [Acidimicrobiales bacterium]
MAIAPLLDIETADWTAELDGAPWPRPALRVVSGRCRAGVGLPEAASPAPGARVDSRERSVQARHAAARRRRAVLLAVVTAGLTCGLVLPLASLGASQVAGHPAPHADVVKGAVYVARPGDTLWSIAARFDHGGDPRGMAEALAEETGSAVVVPGERILIP